MADHEHKLMGEVVAAEYGTGGVKLVGRAIGYSGAPQYLIEDALGIRHFWRDNLTRRATNEEQESYIMVERERNKDQETVTVDQIRHNGKVYERRNCFQKPTHFPHVWHEQFWCGGQGLDETDRIRQGGPDHTTTEVIRGEGKNIIVAGSSAEELEAERERLKYLHIAEAATEPVEGDETDALLASRLAVYGDRINNMERVAQIWSGLLGVEVHDWQIPLLMSAYKMFRTFQTPDYSDNSDDIFGWAKMFQEVMEANHGGIVKARTVEEYDREKAIRNATTSDQEQFYKDHTSEALAKLKHVGSDNPAFQQYGSQDGPCEPGCAGGC